MSHESSPRPTQEDELISSNGIKVLCDAWLLNGTDKKDGITLKKNGEEKVKTRAWFADDFL